MFRYILSLIIFLHGSVHLAGTAQSYGYNIPQLTQDVPRIVGSCWLITAFLFFAASILLVMKKELWFMLASMGIIASQMLIILDWADAKWGSAVNLVLLLAVIVEF